MQNKMEEPMSKVGELRLESNIARKDARLKRGKMPLPLPAEADELFKKAASKLELAVGLLADEISNCRWQIAKGINRDDDICTLLETQSHTIGSLGGTWRDAGQFLKAIHYYDEGYRIELDRKTQCKHKDSYNLLQRIIVRILFAPESISGEYPALVEGVNVLQALDEARKEIEAQVYAGRDDSWALADLALVRFLCNQPAEDAIKDLKILEEQREEQREKQKETLTKLDKRNSDPSFYECTCQVVDALLDEGLGVRTPLASGLKEFRDLLKRKGGLGD